MIIDWRSETPKALTTGAASSFPRTRQAESMAQRRAPPPAATDYAVGVARLQPAGRRYRSAQTTRLESRHRQDQGFLERRHGAIYREQLMPLVQMDNVAGSLGSQPILRVRRRRPARWSLVVDRYRHRRTAAHTSEVAAPQSGILSFRSRDKEPGHQK
jgi:hypothetical protein